MPIGNMSTEFTRLEVRISVQPALGADCSRFHQGNQIHSEMMVGWSGCKDPFQGLFPLATYEVGNINKGSQLISSTVIFNIYLCGPHLLCPWLRNLGMIVVSSKGLLKSIRTRRLCAETAAPSTSAAEVQQSQEPLLCSA